jgi:hypothetical protein
MGYTLLAAMLLFQNPGLGSGSMEYVQTISVNDSLGKVSATESKKGSFYFYWGWNREHYSTSDIQFSGVDYDFELESVVANDRQSAFSVDKYLRPSKMTIPQYNFRLGYFFSEHWNASLGIDHMKYVVEQNQVVAITGFIDGSPTYLGVYEQAPIVLKTDFLVFEHTDGLNYIQAGIRHQGNVWETDKLDIGLLEGLELGMLLPKTNTTLLKKERYDAFHLAGYGVSAIVGVQFLFYNHFFIQSECKGGWINMPDIKTSTSPLDHASQYFYFYQYNLVFGYAFHLMKDANKP